MALDNVGTRDEHVVHVASLRPDLIKLDRSIVKGIGDDERKAAILVTFREVAESFGALLVAEGIEHPGELRRVIELRAPLGQGYVLGPPTLRPRSSPPSPAAEVLEKD